LATIRTNNDPPRGAEAEGGSARPAVDRVALVINELAPGGGERVVAHLAGRLPARSVRTLVVCLGRSGTLADQIELAGGAVTAIGSTKGYDLGAIGRLAKTLRRFAPAVINCHDRSSMPYLVLANLLAGRRPVVYSAHGLLFNADREPRLRHRLAMRGAALATAVSDQVARRHAEYLAWSKGFTIIPNGVPDVPASNDQRQAVRRELGIDHEGFVFLAVGNARPEKGFEDLLDAAASLGRAMPARNVTVLVAGKMPDSPYCRDLLARQRQLGLERAVRFLGYRGDTHALYSAADAFVLSSRSEGLPLVLLEAMTAGLPVVATRVGGVPDAATDCAALLVDPACPRDLGQAMATLAGDGQLQRRLGQEARRIALANYGVETMVSRYIDAYGRAAAGKRRPVKPGAPAQGPQDRPPGDAG
jgi:glycosyltransferase involved in cell wall biosynthesis